MERRALRTAELSTGNRDDALDVVQDAMLVLARRYGHLGPEDWGPLFHRVLQSRIMDWHRRTKVRNRFRVWLRGSDEEREDPLESRPAPPGVAPEHGVERGRFAESLERALTALPPRQRQAFLLRTWEGLDVAATALAMGCSQGSVKTHYSRAVHALRDRLEEFHD